MIADHGDVKEALAKSLMPAGCISSASNEVEKINPDPEPAVFDGELADDRERSAVAHPSENCFVVNRKLTPAEIIGHRLFPRSYAEFPEKVPINGRDVVVSNTISTLSFVDRVRVLVSGRLQVETRTMTENVVGATFTVGAFSALPPLFLDSAERKS